MIQLYIYTYFFIFFSIMVYYRILNIIPCAIQWDLVFKHMAFTARLPAFKTSTNIH